MTPTGDNFTKEPTGYIVCNGCALAYWLPDGVEADVVDVPPWHSAGDAASDLDADSDDDSGLGDDSPGAKEPTL